MATADSDGLHSIYPYFIFVFHKIFSNWEIAGRMVAVFFGSLAIIPFFYILKNIFERKIVIGACIFFIISPRLIEYLLQRNTRTGVLVFYTYGIMGYLRRIISKKMDLSWVCKSFL